MKGEERTAGLWRPRRACRIVDLTLLPDVPSIFDPDENRLAQRESLSFLHAFRRALQSPVDNPDRIHIDYVPSQLVGEWIRHFMRVGGQAIDGLAWDSARRPGSRCVVLWVARDQCLEVGDDLPPLAR